MKKRHKHPVCLNCSRPLSSSDNFCAECGQENHFQKRGVGVLMHDFFSNYFSFDSKITRSTIPFLVRPGVLTLNYNQGKRSSFVHPLRLYLIVTFVFFFLLALLVDKVIEEGQVSLVNAETSISPNEELSAEEIAKLHKLQTTTDSIHNRLNAKTAAVVELPRVKATDGDATLDFGGSGKRYISMFRNKSLTDEQVLDSLQMDKKKDVDRLIVQQTRKLAQKDLDVFLPYLAKNLSILMFLLLPIFAFYLYVLFGRKEKYYISHAIHALHLHAFSFLVLSLLLVLELAGNSLVSNNKAFLIAAFLLITLYALFSVKKVYGQGWGKTILKFNILGFFYLISLSIGMVMEALVSFVLF